MPKQNINVSDRVENQLPEFIREEDTQLVNFLFQYYKSQEKTGRPYDILNNLLNYLDLDAYSTRELTGSTELLNDIDTANTKIEIESIDGFRDKNGSIMIDNEVIYYETVTRGPDAIITPGLSYPQFKKKEQQLENPFPLFDGTRTAFPLSFLGTPVTPPSAEHLIVIAYNQLMIPGVDYTLDNSTINFTSAPRARTGADNSDFTQFTYLVGYADQTIKTLDTVDGSVYNGKKEYPLKFNTENYSPTSESGLLVNKNGRLLTPYEDYTIFYDKLIFDNPVSGSDAIHIRSVEYIAPSYGSGAVGIVEVDDSGSVSKIRSKVGGSGYRLDFNPKVSIQSNTGRGATARSLVGGVKNINLIDGGQGYTSYNPPIPIVARPSSANGSPAKLSLTVDDETGQVSEISLDNSGSGYEFIPAITFVNPGGAKISGATIDSEGRLNQGSIVVDNGGLNYTNPPMVYIDPAPIGGIDAKATARINQESQVYEILITNRGRGYTTAPRVAIIDPVGAQVLDVTVASGSVTNIEMLTGGSGYTDAPSVYIVDDRKDSAGVSIGGTGATAVATIFNGEITDINITNFGQGYSTTEPPKIFIAEPKAARASLEVGFGEVTGYDIIESGAGYTPSAFEGCSRGVSGAVRFDNFNNEIYAKEDQLRQSSHNEGATVVSLDSLFIKQVFDKFRRQYLPTIEIDYTKINPIQVIKNISDFYASKGTELATQYLFKILFGEDVSLYYPRDEIISPSAATWVVDTVLRAQLIEGDPNNLIDSQVNQYADAVDQNIKAANALIENVITIIEGTDTIYELAISEETLEGEFKIPYKTTLVEPLTTDGQIITVDSTIGWPERNGTIRINDEEVVQYKEKSLNQFIECTRSKNGVVEDWDPGTTITSDIYIYVNRGTAQECKLRILGIAEAGTTVLDDTGSYYIPGDKLKVANLGSTAVEERLSSWLYNVKKLISVTSITPGGINNQTATVVCRNPHGLLVSDQVTVYGANPVVYNGTFTVTSRIDDFTFSYQIATGTELIPQGNILLSVDLNRGKSDIASINKVISEFTTNIQNSFFNDQYVYVAASGLPNYKIGPFTGSALIPGNQRKLLRFPRNVETISERKNIKENSPIGAWVNGVSIWSYKSIESVQFGPLTSISVTSPGEGYDAGAKPNLEINGGGGSGAVASVVVDGSLIGFSVTASGSGYTESPLVSIVGGGGSGATAQAVITGGRVTRILVEQPGSGYTSQPSVSITGGGGTGAEATAQVRGPISKVNVTNFGSGYTSLPEVKVNSGEGALAQPIVINGRIVSIAIINSGQKYTSAPNVIINGDGFGAIAQATIGTTGEDKGRVLSIQITNKGIGYTQGNTTVRLESVGQLATFEAQVFKWNKNLQYDLSAKYDNARGYVFTGYNNQFGGEYAHLSDPKELRYVVGDNVFLDPVTQRFQELESNYRHSPILGWAFDGNPIYGPYGYIDPTDQNSGIRRLRTSYKLKDNVVYDEDTNPNPAREDGPSLTTYPAGTFVTDYTYDFQSGDLDNYNGRFCKTPDYPDGTYAYFITIDASDAGIAEFPYIIGPQFNSLPDEWNFSQTATQENIPAGVVRYRDPYVDVDIDIDRQPNQEADVLTTELEGWPIIFEIQDSNNDGIIDANEQQEILEMSEEATLQIYDYFPQVSEESRVDIEVETTTQFENAQIDGFVIENPGKSYQVNDTVFFNNEGTGGFGASAFIESVKGQKISAYTKEIINDRPYGVITTETDHELRQQDEIIVNSRPITDNTSKTFKVKVVSGIEGITINQSGTGYNSDIPPTFELITSAGQDAQLELKLENTGQVNEVNIINSGNGYDSDNPPQIRISHPQQYKKTRYWVSELNESAGNVVVLDTQTTDDRRTYVCGYVTEADGDQSGFLAKFDDLGQLVWKRTLLPQNTGVKKAEFVKMYINSAPENDLIYVAGQTYDPSNTTYNPDVWIGLYESGFNNANDPDGILKWQKSIAGISGSTRRDYITTITLDQEQRIYLGGYTDSNSPDPNDMWIIQCDIEGNLVEKRKIASEDGSEELMQLEWIADDRFFFVGVNQENDDCIFGVFFFDGANLEIDYIRQIPTVGGYVRNPRFVIDGYDDVVLVWDIYNNAASKQDKIQVNKFAVSTAQTAWEWSKSLTITGDFISISHAGVSVDVFGNYTIVSDIVESENSRYSMITYMKYDGTIIKESKIVDTDNIGFEVKAHSVDNSGDPILAVDRRKADQLAAYRFDTTDTINDDVTKRDLGTFVYFDADETSLDTAIYKFGTSSLKLNDVAPVSITGFAQTTQEWSLRGWFAMNTTAHGTDHKPVLFAVDPVSGSNAYMVLDGDSSSADYGKALIFINNAQVASSTSTTNWTTFASAAWVHVTFQKRLESLGLYQYEVYINGNLITNFQSTTDIGLDDVVLGGPISSPTTANSFRGHIDDIVVDDDAPYTSTYTIPTAYIPVTDSVSDIALIKFDRNHTKRNDSYTMTGLDNWSTFAMQASEAATVWTSLNQSAISVWEIGPGGLQILDMSQTSANLQPATYTFSDEKFEYATRTSTIPSPLGKQMSIEANVISKFYLRDALYQKIDNVKEFTFNQNVKLTKGSILQQFNSAGITQAYGTIVEVPVGTLTNPGFGTKYKIGKIFGNFNNDNRFRTTANDVNQITGEYFKTEEEESPWQASTAYAAGDRVYNAKRIYEAQGAGTSGTIAPVHTAGAASDGVINWSLVADAGSFDIDLTQHPYPRPQYLGLDMPEWQPHILYAVGQKVWYRLNVYEVAPSGGGVTTTTPPTHTTGDVSDGTVTWRFVSTSEAISAKARLMAYDQGNNYTVEIVKVHPGSTFIPGDVVSLNSNNIDLADDEKSVTISGFASVKEIKVTARLEKDILRTTEARTNLVYCTSNSPHYFKEDEIIFSEGFQGDQFNGSFFVDQVIGSREFTFAIRATAVSDPAFEQNAIARVNIYGKHPTLEFTRDHQYVFDVSDPSNFGYYLSFSQDNQFKLEYSFNNITREGTPGINAAGSTAPFVKFSVLGQVTNISYYFDPSRTGADSPVGSNSFIDVITTPYQGIFRISEVPTDKQFKFPLLKEPERNAAEVIDDEFDNPYSFYSTTSTRAVGPINSIKLVSPGGFYQKLPIISDIASFRQIEKLVINDGGTEYAPGVYSQIDVDGDGEGGKATITVEFDDEVGSGTITEAVITDPGKGYTTASIDIDGIPGILGSTLAGSGGSVSVIIPDEGEGASVFLTGKNIGKIRRLKNNEFGFGYSHDYTLKPEITFPVNLQLFNTSILSEIKITNPGSGYTSTPAVVIEGGGGEGADAEAVVKNNRLSEIIIKNPGAGYSSEPTVTLKSEFNYVVNLDLNYLQFNFPHGITTGAEVQFRADDVGSTEGQLPRPSSAGLTALIEGQTYYAIAGNVNGLESDQIRFALTAAAAASGDFITFLTQGEGRQVLLTEVFGGAAEAVVETSRFLEGETVFQGTNIEQATATGTVSNNTGWQIGPKILKIVDYTGDWESGERVTGTISKASGVIDNFSIARGVLNIGSLTRTPGRFIDDVGKPSEIVQKIQDSFFYQNFSYVIKSETPITNWKTQILENNHPAGFNLFGQLELSGGKDVSGRKIGTEFTKQVNINNYSNVNEITSFGAAQPIYTDYNNTEVLFRKKRLTSSEEILTSIVKKLDDISGRFNGIDKQFPITVEGEQVIVNQDQLMITLNGVIQAPGDSYSVVGGNLVFSEPPKPPSKVNYRNISISTIPITRINLYSGQVGIPNYGIFPTLGQQIQGENSDAVATVIGSGTNHIDVININGVFELNEEIVRGSLFSALVQSIEVQNTNTIYEFGESITNLNGDTAIIEENNLSDGVISDDLVISKTSGTAKYETGIFNIRLNDYIISAKSNIAAQVTSISPYRDPNTSDIVDELIINQGSSFFGLLFERLVSLTNPNVILDDISKSSITPTELYDASERINADFLDFEEIRSTEIVYTNLANGTFEEGDTIINKEVDYGNATSVYHGGAANRFKDSSRMILGNKQEIIDFGEAEIAVWHPGFYFPGDVITNSWSRFSDAYRLIQRNKLYIAARAYDEMITQYPSLSVPDEDKCLRDLEYYIDAISLDIHRGGNVYTRKFVLKYFNAGTFDYVNSEVAETRFGYEKAKDWMIKALTNNIDQDYTGLSGPNAGIVFKPWNEIDKGGSRGLGITADPSPNDDYGTAGSNADNTDVNVCTDVQDAITTLYGVIDEALENGNTTDLPDETEGTYSVGQTKCRRDVGLLVDAIAGDVSQGGNYNIVEFAKRYFDADGNPITNGLIGEYAESLTAFEKARDLCYRAINNLLYYQVNTTTPETGYMLNDPTTYAGPYSGGETSVTQLDVSAASYTASTGELILTVGSGHGLTTSDTLYVRPYSLRFTCDSDNHATFHDYPRSGDPAFNSARNITATSATTLTINIGASTNSSFTPTAATYNTQTGDLTLTIGTHTLGLNDYVTIADDALTFTCTQDDDATSHTYPRSTDPASGQRLFITAKTDTTITVNVGASPVGQQYDHTFVSAVANSVTYGGGYTHTFIKALDNAVYSGGGTRAQYFDQNYSSGNNQQIGNCANVQAYIHTLVNIASTALEAGDLTNINALSSVTDGTFVDGETVRTTKLGYDDKSTGLFTTNDIIKGVSSNASFTAVGVNSGLKWLFAGNITGTFTIGEYITNSRLTNQNSVTQSVITKKTELSGTKSIAFPATGYLNMPESNDFAFGTGEFTIQGWIRVPNVVGLKTLFDLRRVSTTGLRFVLDGTTLRAYNGTSQLVSGGTLAADTWYHIALIRSSAVTRIYLDGTQVGSDAADTNDYGYAPLYIGADFNGSNSFQGWMDNVVVKKGTADYSSAFTAPTQINYANQNNDIVFGLDGEGPFILSTTETYATLTGQKTSSATVKKVDYTATSLIIKDVDLGRAVYKNLADIVELNDEWIAEEAVGRMKAKFPDFIMPGDNAAEGLYTGTNYCLRDTKDFIIGSLVKDLREGGNYHTLYTGRTYLEASGKLKHVGNEILQTLYTWNEVYDIIENSIVRNNADTGVGVYTTRLRIPQTQYPTVTSTVQAFLDETRLLIDDLLEVLAPTGDRFRDGGVNIWKNRDYIAEETVGYLQNKYQATLNGTDYDFLEMPGGGESSCKRDIRTHIIPAIIGDLCTGGTYQTEKILDSYLDSQNNILYVEEELNPMIDAFHFTNMLCQKAVNNLLLSPGETAGELSVPAWVQDDYYSPLYTSRAAYKDNTLEVDPQGYPQNNRNSNDRYIDAVNTIQRNKDIIAMESVATMNDFSKFENLAIPGGPVNCEDDVRDIIDAVSHDLLFDCNEKTYDAAALYVETENNSLKHIESEWEASVTTYKIARDMMTLTMRNGFGRDYVDGNDPLTVPVQSYEQNPKEDIYRDAADAIDANIRYIAEQAVDAGETQYPSLVIPGGSINCVHDVTDILRALVFNLKYGGNNMLQYATEFYVNDAGNLQHISSQSAETIWIINKARDFVKRAMKGQIITNTSGYGVAQRFYDSVAKPTNQLRPSNQTDGVDLTAFNNLVTRSFTNGTTDINNSENSATGQANNEDLVCRVTTTLPSGTPTDGVLWEGGGSDYGSWIGIRDSGTYFRLRAGDGGNSFAGGATYTDTGLALLDIPISDLSDYFDGGTHEIVWQINVGGNTATGPGLVKVWFDGVPVGEAQTPGTSNTGLGANSGYWSGGGNGGFGATSGVSGGVPSGEPTAAWAYTTSDLDYYRARRVDESYTGTETDEVSSEIDTLMAFVTDGLASPAQVNSRGYDMPIIWPIKFTPEVTIRDLGITYDTAGGGQDADGTWNQTCSQVASSIDTLMDIVIDTISEAANNNVYHLTSITKTTPATNNTIYQAGTCYNVTSSIDTLFEIMTDTLGGGTENDKIVANRLLFNSHAVAQRAFADTQAQFSDTNLTIEFAEKLTKAVRYDLITGGNAGAFALAQEWFDGEGNFIAFTDVIRTHIIYCMTRVREYIKSVMYLIDTDPGWDTYDLYNPAERFEWNQEAAEFIIDSSINPIEYALELSKFPTEAKVTFIASTDVQNLSNSYEMGVDYNTDPALVSLTPVVDVGFDRQEDRIRINRTNFFRRGDILQYIPVQGATTLSGVGDIGQSYYYVITGTATWFEIGRHYIHDGRFRDLSADTANTGSHQMQVVRRSGVNRATIKYPEDPSETPIQGGFNPADVLVGSTSNTTAEVSRIDQNVAKIRTITTYYKLTGVGTDNFINGETVQVQGAASNNGKIYQTRNKDADNETFVKLISIAGTISAGDVLEGVTSGATGTVSSTAGDINERMLVNVKSGSYATDDWFFDKNSATEAYMSTYTNKSGSLTGNTGGRVTIDVETIQGAWDAGDIVYGSDTDYILDIKGISGTQIQLNQYIHGTNVYQLELGTAITDTGVSDTFRPGDEISLLIGTTEKNPGFRATVTKYINGTNADPEDPNYGIHRLWIGNLRDVGAGAEISEVTNSNNNIGKLDIGSNFPTIYAPVSSYTDTGYSSYGKVIAIEQSGITATIWVENAVGEFVDNMTVKSDDGWGGAVTSARTLTGRVDRYFRGFDGTQTQFDITISNGEAYFPDAAGHLLVFVNGVLQPPGANASYVAFSDKVNFTEAPDIGSEFIGYYVGKLRQLDDISFEFDSLRSSFNLKRDGLFYSLTLTEGVSSNTILPENNIIVSLNGIIQEAGIAYELVGSRIIFAEVPRAGSTFVGFSYIGSDADVIAATVIPPVESGDQLRIEGEEFNREVALIESSNSLITFEYTGSVKGRNADALSTVIGGQVTNAVLTNSGDGYTSRPNVDVISSTGFDAQIKALMGIARIDVKSSGVGYQSPTVLIDNEVPDDFTTPTGTPINGGFDIYAGEGPQGEGGTTIPAGTIAIVQDPVNVTVNQGQSASFSVVSTVTNSQTMNYQWQKKEYGTQVWSNIIGANQSVYNTGVTVQADDGDEYRVAITAAGATPVYSLSAILTVQTGATVISNFSPANIFSSN